MTRARRPPSVAESLREYGRGVAGGFLFSIPLLYTMEVWWAGFTLAPMHLLIGLAAAFLLLCAYNAYAGIRYDTGFTEIAIDSVEELGIGLVVAAGVLLLLGRVGPETPRLEFIGKTVVEGLFVAIGVSVGTAQLAAAADKAHSGSAPGRHDTLTAEVALALCGAILVGANVGPTEEVLRLAAEMNTWHLLATIAVSLLLALTLMFFSHFKGSVRFADTRGAAAITEGTVVTYGAALVAAAAILAFFGRFDGVSPGMGAARCVVLGLPSTLGAAAGRLLLK